MTDGTRIGISWGQMIPRRGTAMLYAIMLIMLTLAACGGDSPDAGRRRRPHRCGAGHCGGSRGDAQAWTERR